MADEAVEPRFVRLKADGDPEILTRDIGWGPIPRRPDEQVPALAVILLLALELPFTSLQGAALERLRSGSQITSVGGPECPGDRDFRTTARCLLLRGQCPVGIDDPAL